MALVFEKITQSLAASDIWRLKIAGASFRLVAATYAVTVRLFSGGRDIGAMSGMLAGDYAEAVQFDEIWIENGAAAQKVSLQIMAGGAGSDRVLGEVSVIDGGRAKVLAGVAYVMTPYGSVVAGQLPHAQIWNPPASGKRVIVERFGLRSTYACSIIVRAASVALSGVSSNAPKSKLVPGGAGVAQSRTESAVGQLGDGVMYGFNLQAGGYIEISLSTPLILPEGAGLNFLGNSVGTDVYTNIEYQEEAI